MFSFIFHIIIIQHIRVYFLAVFPRYLLSYKRKKTITLATIQNSPVQFLLHATNALLRIIIALVVWSLIFFCLLPTGDIGGSLALFLGASVMAVFEILDFLMHTAALKCYVNKHHKHKQRPAPKRHHQHNTYDPPPGLRNPEKINLSPRPRAGGRMDMASGFAEGANGGTYERPDCNKYMPRVAVTERSPSHPAHRNISSDDTAV